MHPKLSSLEKREAQRRSNITEGAGDMTVGADVLWICGFQSASRARLTRQK